MNQSMRESKQNEIFQRTVEIFQADYDRASKEIHTATNMLDAVGLSLAVSMLAYQHALILDRLLLIEEEKE